LLTLAELNHLIDFRCFFF